MKAKIQAACCAIAISDKGVERLTKVGPAVSSDGGRTWRFLNMVKAMVRSIVR